MSYTQYGVNLTNEQAKKIIRSKNNGVSIRLSKINLHGPHKLPLTETQINKIKNSTGGITLNLSKSQLKSMEKTGGFLPLLALLPAALGALGGLTGGIASAVNSSKQTKELERHNKEMEEIEKRKAGSGFLPGKLLKDVNKCHCELNKHGYGLFLTPYTHGGSGLFLSPNSNNL